MTWLVLIRHGQTDWNIAGRWQGQADPSLNERGRQQVRLAAEQLRQFSIVALYSSDLRRALETAKIIGAEMGLRVIADPRLREIHLGVWQGMRSSDIQARYPNDFRRWHTSPLAVRPPNGEDIPTLATRVMQVISEIAARHPDQRVVIVAHELPIAVVVCYARGHTLRQVRDHIPQTGAWQEVIWDEGLIASREESDG